MKRSPVRIAALVVGLLGLVLWTGKYLRQRGAFTEYRTQDGRSALDVATELHRKQTIALLEKAHKDYIDHQVVR